MRALLELFEFGWRNNTKQLLRDLRKQGVEVKRTTTGRSTYRTSGDRPQIIISRGEKHGPVATLHHEAGHHATRGRILEDDYRLNPYNSLSRFRRSPRYKAIRKSLDAKGGELSNSIYKARKMRRTLETERAANQAARKRMEPGMRKDYDRRMKKAYATYVEAADDPRAQAIARKLSSHIPTRGKKWWQSGSVRAGEG